MSPKDLEVESWVSVLDVSFEIDVESEPCQETPPLSSDSLHHLPIFIFIFMLWIRRHKYVGWGVVGSNVSS